MTTEFPAVFKVVGGDTSAAERQVSAGLDRITSRGRQQLSQFSEDAQRLLDQALSVQRNDSGSLDLQVDQLRQAALAQEQRAVAARELADATLRAAQADGIFNQEMRESVAAVRRLATEEERLAAQLRGQVTAYDAVQRELNQTKSATDALIQSRRQGTTASGNVINSTRAERTAFVQLGQQLQDVTIQAQLGTAATQIFAQQVPQAAFALTGLANSADATRRGIGQVATFLSGPWGAAIFAATAVLGPFIAGLFDSSDAAGDLADELAKVESRADQTTAALVSLRNQRIRNSISELDAAQRSVIAIQNDIQRGAEAIRELQGRDQSEFRDRSIEALREGQARRQEELAQRRLDLQQAEINEEERLDRERGRGGRSREAEQRRQIREAQRLRDFSAEAAREIAAINNRFLEIPPGVAQVTRSVQELDDLIAELGEREPPGFRQLIEDAQTLRDELAQSGIFDAIEQELGRIVQQSDTQLQQQRLIIAGRFEEAEVLRIMERLQQQYGEASREYLNDVRDIVAARFEEIEALDRIQDRLDAYTQATRSIQRELESLLSGEGADFQRVFRRLQARLTVQNVFGDALQSIERETRASLGQAVDALADQTDDARTALVQHTDALTQATARINGQATAQTSAGLASDFDRTFAGAVGSANDNQIDVIARATRATEDGIGGLSPTDYAELVVSNLTRPLLDELPDGISRQLAPVLNGALSGLLTAGPVGGVLGGLDRLIGDELGSGISNALGSAIDGAQLGAQTSLILDSLGIGNSSTGAALGGAAGSLLPIPGGSAIGSILGSLVFGSFSGQSRGSARIGGSGNGLDIVGFFGGNNEREQQSAEFARAAIDTIEQFALQLGADLNTAAGRVSIGIRDENIRVDTAGRGFTKLRGNPEVFDFGSDAEAAVSFAVQDLINDGVISGLSRAEQNLIRAGNDIERSIDDVLTFRSVFDRLNGLDNPLGADIAALNSEFEELISLFERAGASAAEFADLERLYDLERAQLVEEATDRIAGSLQNLINDLTIGDNGFSLRARQASAEEQFDSLASRVAAGDTTAFDDFEDSARALLDIERQLFGSQERYFDRVEEVLALSRNAVNEQQSALQNAAGAGSPFDGPNPNFDLSPIGVPLAEQNNILNNQLGAVNSNLGQMIRLLSAPPVGSLARRGEPRFNTFAF